jgi:hypothetical protein
MSHARRACPRGGRNEEAARTHSLLRFSRLGPSRPVMAGGARALNTAPTTSRNASHEHSFDAGLTAAAALAGPPRGGRTARRYAHSCLPQRPAAKLAPRGQARLWGTIATLTQQNATRRHATGTQPKDWGRNATGTQPNANVGTATRVRRSLRANAGPRHRGQSRLREGSANRTKDAETGPNAAQRRWATGWTAQRSPVYCFLTVRSRCVPNWPLINSPTLSPARHISPKKWQSRRICLTDVRQPQRRSIA